jgi:hypothetical protein
MEVREGNKAIQILRNSRHNKLIYVELHHLTYNRKTNSTDGMRVVRRAQLRPGLPSDKFDVSSELYLTYKDLDAEVNNQNRMCRRRLIRAIAFPPDYILKKVKWFV